MPRKWGILIMNAGKEPELLHVYDDGKRRPAEFHTLTAAKECQRVINRFRTDSAFIGTTLRRL